MKRLSSRSIHVVSLFLLFTLFLSSCAPKKSQQAEGEALKLAARAFQPTLINLDAILKSGDIQAARDTLALLSEKLKTIEAAEIPARLADKANNVKDQLTALSTAMDDLSSTLGNPELASIDTTVLNQYATVRINFARLGSLLRFKIPELVSFHDDVLHDVWHEAYPNDDIAAIKAAVPAFKAKAAALNNVQWPEALGYQIEAIKGKVADLQKAVNTLETACQGDDADAIKKATEDVHSLYEQIARML
ncbi:MAG: hypothetical protein ONB16_11255 [candidate division KSB1 bacterium]|nr:hypothetical protein [candidate division KSB1 bacterium]MDZ7339706.1 hypothetical protein [candidate division KSB1 bacterium]